MATSLAAQLQQRTTLDSSRLATQKSLKHPPSFIYTPRHAAQVTTSDLHSIASNAWDQLATIDPFFEKYHNKILGEEAKGTDRSGLTKEENDKLDKVLDKVLRALGKHILLKPAGVVLEWLVRRFRVNDLNIPSLLALFLPYHTTPHFPSALSLIPEATLLTTSAFAPLIPVRKSLAPLPLNDLIALLPPFSSQVAARPLLDYILHLPLAFLENDEKVHRALVGFWLQVLAGYLDRAGSRLPEGERAAVLSTILEVIKQSRSQPDMLIASYILLARYSMHNPLEGETLRVVMKTVVGNRARKEVGDEETDAAFVTTLVVLSQLGEGEMEVAEGKKFLGGTGWKALMRVQALGDLVVQLSNEYNAERFMKPFLNTLAIEAISSAESASLLSSLLIPRISEAGEPTVLLPKPVIAHLTTSTLSAILTSEPDTDPAPLLKVLSQVYQRFPEVWEAETKSRTAKTDEEDLPLLWSIMNTVLGGGSVAQEPKGMFLSSSSPDVAVRVLALQDLLKAAKELKEENPEFLHDTLLARLREPVAEVSKVVLAPSTLAIVHASLSGEGIFAALTSVLDSPKLDSAILDTVLPYLAGSFVEAHPQLADQVLQQSFWSRILSGKNDVKERVAGWKALKGSKLEKSHSWIKGVGAAFELGVEADGQTLKNGVQANEKVVSIVAKNIAALPSADLSKATTFLLAHLAVPTAERLTDEPSTLAASASLFSILVSLQLASKLPRAERLSFVLAALEALRATQQGLDAFAAPQPESLLDDKTKEVAPLVAQSIFGKPQSPKTLRRSRAALLSAVVAAVQSVKKAQWTWLAPTAGQEEEITTYTSLVHSIYRLAHTGTTPGASAFSSTLLKSLFSHLVTDDSLAFLASVWTSKSTPAQLKTIALRDAATFVEVHSSSAGKKIDFQTLVPSVVVALADADKKVRIAALELLAVVQRGIPTVAAGVYGRDQYYCATSTALKYLDVADTSKYLVKLLASRTELIMDGSYLLTLHQSLLDETTDASSSKKKVTLKVKVLTFLLSHVLAWRSIGARTTLLRAVSGIKDVAKGALVIPILAEVVASTPAQRLESTQHVEQTVVEEYGRLLLQPFEGASKKWIEQTENKALDTYVKALELADGKAVGSVLRKEALSILSSSLFSVVRGDARVDVFKRLVRLATLPDARLTADVLVCLRNIKVDNSTITSFLNEIRLSLSSPVSKGAKRGRTSIGATPARPERLPELVVLLESIEFKSVSASHALLLSLFDLLSSIIEIPAAAQVDVQYPGQLMLSTLSKVVENVQPSSGITSDSIRMAPVLDLMRSSNNPQTYHQALLLLAQLGPLVPDQLVHNVMPIFTFMGANVLQRDDAYSLRVVEKTLESIVPALVKSTKRSSGNRDALVSDLKQLLSIFTDAAAHVPRHRRISLFVRFVETLGAQEFLSAVAMLLVDKEVKVVDGSSLPLALFENFSVDIQLTAFAQINAEVSRLLEGEKSFLDLPSSNEAGPSSGPQRQVVGLLTFLAVGLEAKQLGSKVDAARAAGSQTVDPALSGLVRGLLDVAAPPSSNYSASDKEELAAATGYGVHAAVHLMSTHSFSDAILWLLDLADPAIQARALALLRTRLPNIKPSRRAEISPAVVTVVERIRSLLAKSGTDSEGALETLDIVASSIFPEEDAVLAKTVPELMAVARSAQNSKSTRAVAIGILTKLTNRLGPRLIPLASKLIPFAVEMLKEEAQDPLSAAASVVTASFQVIEGLFMSIPTFIGGQVDKVFSAALSPEILSLSEEKHSAASKARALLLSTAAKKLPAKTLYPAIIRLHASLDGASKQPILGLLDLLNRALRQGKTADIAENYRQVFKLFLTVFDLRREHVASLSLEDIGDIEENGLGAFVQFILKLNEQTFRPLFLRTYDWAVIDLADEENAVASLTARRVVLYKLVDRLLTQLRSIVVPYFSFMLDQTVELLESFAKGDLQDVALWTSVVSALTKALDYDETGFWTPLRLSKLSSPIAHQLETPYHLTSALITSHFHPLLSAYSQALLPHENHLKAFNTSLLMLTRSDDLRVKRGALEALDQLWESLGDGMLGLVPETTPFLAETMEEAEGGVEAATRTLVKRIEEHLGESLSSYLES